MGFEARQLGINSSLPPPRYGSVKIDLALWTYSVSHIPIVRGVGWGEKGVKCWAEPFNHNRSKITTSLPPGWFQVFNLNLTFNHWLQAQFPSGWCVTSCVLSNLLGPPCFQTGRQKNFYFTIIIHKSSCTNHPQLELLYSDDCQGTAKIPLRKLFSKLALSFVINQPSKHAANRGWESGKWMPDFMWMKWKKRPAIKLLATKHRQDAGRGNTVQS